MEKPWFSAWVSPSSELQTALHCRSSVDLRRGHAPRDTDKISALPCKPLGPSRHCGHTYPCVLLLTASSCHSSLGPPRELEPAVPGNPHTKRALTQAWWGGILCPVVGWPRLHHQHLTRIHKDIFPAFATWHFQKQWRKKRERVRSGD